MAWWFRASKVPARARGRVRLTIFGAPRSDRRRAPTIHYRIESAEDSLTVSPEQRRAMTGEQQR